MAKNLGRIQCLDGLRGIACLMIFVHHFLLTFYPATFYGDSAISHGFMKWDAYISQSPMGAIFNGNFWVCEFLLISGFVISGKIYRCEESDYAEIMIKRYLKLAFPIFVVSILVYFLLKNNFLYHSEINEITGSDWTATHYNNVENVSVKDIFLTSFYKVEFIGDNTFSTAFWMLSYLFFGYYVAILLAIMSKGKDNRIIMVFGILGVIFWHQCSYLVMSIIGAGIAYFYEYYKRLFIERRISCVFIVLALFFAGYPTGVVPDNIYANIDMDYLSMHIVAATLLFIGIMKSTIFRKILEGRICLFLGNISFAVYLVHIPILFSVTHYIFMRLFSRGIGYQISSIITFVMSIIIVVFIAHVFNIFIEVPCDKFSKKIIKQICINKNF